jgi:hypothetical protein
VGNNVILNNNIIYNKFMRLHQKRKEILRNSGEQQGRENNKFMKYVRMHQKNDQKCTKKRRKIHQKTIKNAPKNDQK